jgi:hypothetical protein
LDFFHCLGKTIACSATGIFMNSTCGLPSQDGSPTIPCTTSELDEHGKADPNYDGIDPDLIMTGVGRHKDHFFSQQTFYARAANGTLPELSWLMPPAEACDHPCFDVSVQCMSRNMLPTHADVCT